MTLNYNRRYKTLGHEVMYTKARGKVAAMLMIDNSKFQVTSKEHPMYAEHYTLQFHPGVSVITINMYIRGKLVGAPSYAYHLDASKVEYGAGLTAFNNNTEFKGFTDGLKRAFIILGKLQMALERFHKRGRELCYLQFREFKGSRQAAYFFGIQTQFTGRPKTPPTILNSNEPLKLGGVSISKQVASQSEELAAIRADDARDFGDYFLSTQGLLKLNNTSGRRELIILAYKPEVINILTGEEVNSGYQWQWKESDMGTERFNKLLARFDNNSEVGPIARIQKRHEDVKRHFKAPLQGRAQ